MAGLELVARDSLSRIQNSTEAVIYLSEVQRRDNDERNWSFSYLREQLQLKSSQELFRRYQARVQHALFMELLIFNLLYNGLALTAFLTLPKENSGVVTVGLACRSVSVIVHMVVFAASYQETWFRSRQSKAYVACLVLVMMLIGEQGTSIFRLAIGRCSPTVRSTYYIILTSGVLLPFARKVHSAAACGIAIVMDLLISGLSCQKDTENQAILISADAVFLLVTATVGLYIRYLIEVMSRRAFLDRRECIESKIKIETEQNQEEKLLQSILPLHIAGQVRQDIRDTIQNMDRIRIQKPFNKLYVEKYKGVSILYADIVNSMLLAASLKVADLVATLNDLFGRFDDSAERNKCMRIKLLGDCYYCVSGVPFRDERHADNCVVTGLDMIDIIRSVREKRKVDVDMRIGIHSGNILSGLLGLRKWQFDIWSRDVTIASHMEQAGVPGHVHITKATKEQLSGSYVLQSGEGHLRDSYLQHEGVETFIISPQNKRLQNKRSSVPESPDGNDKGEPHHFQRQTSASSPQKSRLSKRLSSGVGIVTARRRGAVALDYSLIQYRKMVSQVNQIMERAIDKMALSKKDQWFSSEGIQPLLLTFRELNHERPYLQQPDPLFKYYLLCMLIIFCGITIIHLLIMSRTLVFWISYGVTFIVIIAACVPTWAGYLWITIKKEDDQKLLSSSILTVSRKVWQTVAIRVVIWLVISTMLLFCSMLGLNECLKTSVFGSLFFGSGINITSSVPTNATDITEDNLNCGYPWFYTLCAALAMTTTSVFLRIHFLLKLLLNGLSLVGFWFVIDVHGEKVFQQESRLLSDWNEFGRPVDQSHCFYLVLVVVILHVLDRQVEYVSRLDYLWKMRLKGEQEEARIMELVNRLLLQNILPIHVAEFYMNRQHNRMDEIYHEEYSSVAVMFASIPNFANFYYEDYENEEGLRCIQLLNEIICDFDQLLFEKSFSKVEKIKTIGSTYMAACGLHSSSKRKKEQQHFEEDPMSNVMVLVRFAIEMMGTLQQLNKDAMQEFQLRVGISVGPVMAGVVGTVKPQYDIWGDTVNVASRMDSTGVNGRIQVVKEVAELVKADGTFQCESRGEIFVKGKGNLTTFLLHTPYDEPYYELSRL